MRQWYGAPMHSANHPFSAAASTSVRVAVSVFMGASMERPYSSGSAFSRSFVDERIDIRQMMAGTVKEVADHGNEQTHCRPAQHAENDVAHHAGAVTEADQRTSEFAVQPSEDSCVGAERPDVVYLPVDP